MSGGASGGRRGLGLAGKIVVAIVVGVGLGFLCMRCGAAGDVAMRALKTFNVLFGQVLRFIVPLLILGLVTPAIADAGKGAGRLLVSVMVFSYVSTCVAALFGYFSAGALLPHYVAEGAFASAGNGKVFLPLIDIKIPPVCDVLTALALAFMVGVGIVFTGASSLKRGVDDFAGVVKLTIEYFTDFAQYSSRHIHSFTHVCHGICGDACFSNKVLLHHLLVD